MPEAMNSAEGRRICRRRPAPQDERPSGRFPAGRHITAVVRTTLAGKKPPDIAIELGCETLQILLDNPACYITAAKNRLLGFQVIRSARPVLDASLFDWGGSGAETLGRNQSLFYGH